MVHVDQVVAEMEAVVKGAANAVAMVLIAVQHLQAPVVEDARPLLAERGDRHHGIDDGTDLRVHGSTRHQLLKTDLHVIGLGTPERL